MMIGVATALFGLSTISYATDQIAIKGISLGSTMAETRVALGKALNVNPADFVTVDVMDEGNKKSCLFVPKAKNEKQEELQHYCKINSAHLSFAMMQEEFAYLSINDVQNTATKLAGGNVAPPIISQAPALANFTNDRLTMLVFNSHITERIFNYNQVDFTVFAKGFIDAYGIPELNDTKCKWVDAYGCWEYRTNDGAFVTLIDLGNSAKSAPFIMFYKIAGAKPLNF